MIDKRKKLCYYKDVLKDRDNKLEQAGTRGKRRGLHIK